MEVDYATNLTPCRSPASEDSVSVSCTGDDEISTASISSSPISSPRHDSVFIPNVSLKYNFYHHEAAKFLSESRNHIPEQKFAFDFGARTLSGPMSVIPRTAPCFVLSKSGHNFGSPLFPVVTSRKKSKSNNSEAEPELDSEQEHENENENCGNTNTTDLEAPAVAADKSKSASASLPLSFGKTSNKIWAENKTAKSFGVDKLLNEDNTSFTSNSKPKNGNSKKLTFGIDRILSQDRPTTNATVVTGESLDQKMCLSLHSIEDNYHDSNSISSKLAAPIHLQQSQTQSNESQPNAHLHQHQPGYSSHCSECVLLSRYYYKIQMPIPRSLTNYSSYSWMNSQSIFDNQNNNGTPHFAHHHQGSGAGLSTTFGHYNSAAVNYASMVSCNNVNGNGRRKRSWSRAVFSNLQRKGLEKRFQIQKYITKPDRRDLAAALGLSDAQVKVWFQNRRMKWRHTKDGKIGGDDMTSYKTITNDKK